MSNIRVDGVYWLAHVLCVVRVTAVSTKLVSYDTVIDVRWNIDQRMCRYTSSSLFRPTFEHNALMVILPRDASWYEHVFAFRESKVGESYVTGTGHNMYTRHEKSNLVSMPYGVGYRRFIMNPASVNKTGCGLVTGAVKTKTADLKNAAAALTSEMQDSVTKIDMTAVHKLMVDTIAYKGPEPDISVLRDHTAFETNLALHLMSESPPCQHFAVSTGKAREGSDKIKCMLFTSDMHIGSTNNSKGDIDMSNIEYEVKKLKVKVKEAKDLRIKAAEKALEDRDGILTKAVNIVLKKKKDDLDRDTKVLREIPPGLTADYDKLLQQLDLVAGSTVKSCDLCTAPITLIMCAEDISEYTIRLGDILTV